MGGCRQKELDWPQTSEAVLTHKPVCLHAAVVQMLVLDRLTGGDLVTAYRLLRVITASAHLSTPGADLEYAPFGFSLVGILHVSGVLCCAVLCRDVCCDAPGFCVL